MAALRLIRAGCRLGPRDWKRSVRDAEGRLFRLKGDLSHDEGVQVPIDTDRVWEVNSINRIQ